MCILLYPTIILYWDPLSPLSRRGAPRRDPLSPWGLCQFGTKTPRERGLWRERRQAANLCVARLSPAVQHCSRAVTRGPWVTAASASPPRHQPQFLEINRTGRRSSVSGLLPLYSTIYSFVPNHTSILLYPSILVFFISNRIFNRDNNTKIEIPR